MGQRKGGQDGQTGSGALDAPTESSRGPPTKPQWVNNRDTGQEYTMYEIGDEVKWVVNGKTCEGTVVKVNETTLLVWNGYRRIEIAINEIS